MLKLITKNIGQNIKKFSKVLYILQIAISVIAIFVGIGLLIAADSDDYFIIAGFSCFGGSVVNAITAVIQLMFLYGFGELVENSKKDQ